MFLTLALVADWGVVRVTQRQMQSAADSGALEGLRQRDSLSVDDRVAAREMVRNVFDDDWNLASDAYDYGAGPIITFSAPTIASPLQLGSYITGISVYDPVPQLNDGTSGPPINEAHGDMLTGNYVAASHSEPMSYVRADFPAGFDESTPHNSFLLRLRRTWNPLGLDDIAGVSSSAPGLRYVFALGTPMYQSSSTTYNPRRDGVNIHTTSIADAQVALSVGPVNTSVNVPPTGMAGISSYGLSLAYWNLLAPGVWSPAQVEATGEITGLGPTTAVRDGHLTRRTQIVAAGIAAGDTTVDVLSNAGFPAVPFKARFEDEVVEVTAIAGTQWTITRGANGTAAAAHAIDTEVVLFETATLTQEFLSGDPLNLPFGFVAVPADVEYIPLFETVGGSERLVGFGAGRLRLVGPAPGAFPVSVEVFKFDSIIPTENAMATLADSVDPLLTAAEVNTIFSLRSTIDQPLRAPALVRAYDAGG